jgi:hypothetical protein
MESEVINPNVPTQAASASRSSEQMQLDTVKNDNAETAGEASLSSSTFTAKAPEGGLTESQRLQGIEAHPALVMRTSAALAVRSNPHHGWQASNVAMAKCDLCSRAGRGVIQKCVRCKLSICKDCCVAGRLDSDIKHHLDPDAVDWDVPPAKPKPRRPSRKGDTRGRASRVAKLRAARSSARLQTGPKVVTGADGSTTLCGDATDGDEASFLATSRQAYGYSENSSTGPATADDRIGSDTRMASELSSTSDNPGIAGLHHRPHSSWEPATPSLASLQREGEQHSRLGWEPQKHSVAQASENYTQRTHTYRSSPHIPYNSVFTSTDHSEGPLRRNLQGWNVNTYSRRRFTGVSPGGTEPTRSWTGRFSLPRFPESNERERAITLPGIRHLTGHTDAVVSEQDNQTMRQAPVSQCHTSESGRQDQPSLHLQPSQASFPTPQQHARPEPRHSEPRRPELPPPLTPPSQRHQHSAQPTPQTSDDVQELGLRLASNALHMNRDDPSAALDVSLRHQVVRSWSRGRDWLPSDADRARAFRALVNATYVASASLGIDCHSNNAALSWLQRQNTITVDPPSGASSSSAWPGEE